VAGPPGRPYRRGVRDEETPADTRITWQIRAEYEGVPSGIQLEAMADNDRPAMLLADGGDGRLEILARFPAGDAATAVAAGLARLDRMTTLADLVHAGILAGPHRLVVETTAAVPA
jgi:hypothetical protein